MDFEEYLHSKKIDSAVFKANEESNFSKMEKLYDQMHPDSFTAQKLFLINPLRRKYNWKEKTEKVKSKPMMRPKIGKPKI